MQRELSVALAECKAAFTPVFNLDANDFTVRMILHAAHIVLCVIRSAYASCIGGQFELELHHDGSTDSDGDDEEEDEEESPSSDA